ncbi:hypothetical protein GLYMA_19G111550v4 [Glycine max]|nr:hypothetical protein GLYMA_19G111550v4 [Glycine max]KAH1077303.1 hypothetical protein GYH30_052710 [Glycine max]
MLPLKQTSQIMHWIQMVLWLAFLPSSPHIHAFK